MKNEKFFKIFFIKDLTTAFFAGIIRSVKDRVDRCGKASIAAERCRKTAAAAFKTIIGESGGSGSEKV